ncbi:hypothetical protein LguiA_033927 [Lonicera macranthoides]
MEKHQMKMMRSNRSNVFEYAGMPRKQGERMKFARSTGKRDFIELCLREVTREGYCGTSLKNVSWTRIAEDMKNKYNKDFDQKQLKNQWDYLKRLYSAWRVLETKTGHGYNPEIGTFDWLDHVWDDMIKKYPDTKRFRNKPLEDKDLLKSLFESTMATGDEAFSPMHPLPKENPRNHQTLEDDDFEAFREEEPLVSQENQPIFDSYFSEYSFYDEHNNPTSDKRTQEHVGQSDGVSSHQSKKKRKKDSVEDPLIQKVDDLIGLIKNDQAADDKTIDECFAAMDELMALGILDEDLYIPAMQAFSDKADHRKFFLKMQSNERKLSFINRIVRNI